MLKSSVKLRETTINIIILIIAAFSTGYNHQDTLTFLGLNPSALLDRFPRWLCSSSGIMQHYTTAGSQWFVRSCAAARNVKKTKSLSKRNYPGSPHVYSSLFLIFCTKQQFVSSKNDLPHGQYKTSIWFLSFFFSWHPFSKSSYWTRERFRLFDWTNEAQHRVDVAGDRTCHRLLTSFVIMLRFLSISWHPWHEMKSEIIPQIHVAFELYCHIVTRLEFVVFAL